MFSKINLLVTYIDYIICNFFYSSTVNINPLNLFTLFTLQPQTLSIFLGLYATGKQYGANLLSWRENEQGFSEYSIDFWSFLENTGDHHEDQRQQIN